MAIGLEPLDFFSMGQERSKFGGSGFASGPQDPRTPGPLQVAAGAERWENEVRLVLPSAGTSRCIPWEAEATGAATGWVLTGLPRKVSSGPVSGERCR